MFVDVFLFYNLKSWIYITGGKAMKDSWGDAQPQFADRLFSSVIADKEEFPWVLQAT